MVKNIPQNKTPDELKEHFLSIIPELEIQYVSYTYKITEMMDILNKQAQWMQKRNYLISYKKRRLEKLGITEEEARATGAEVYPPPETFLCFSTAWPTVEHCEKELQELQQ